MEPLLLHADHLLTMDAANSIISDAAILVDSRGRIGALGPASAVLPAHPGVPVRRLNER